MLQPLVTEINAEILKTQLESEFTGELGVMYKTECPSTNSECMAVAPQQGEQVVVVVSEQQTSGRGRRGKVWHSPAGKNIYCSIGLSIDIEARYLGLISLQTGVSIVEVLRQNGFETVYLKWPNDVICDGKKLGGILIETRVLDSGQFYLVIGFGLNVNQDMAQLDEQGKTQIDQPAISLSQIADQNLDRQQLLLQIIPAIINAIQGLSNETFSHLTQRFSELDFLQGKEVCVKTMNDEQNGQYLGITETGLIRVQIGSSEEHFSAAEISLREAPNVTD